MKLFQEGVEEEQNHEKVSVPYEHSKKKLKLESKQRKERKISERLLTIVQVSVCGVILIAALIVKLLGGEMYQTVKDWYYQNLNRSIVAEEQFDQVRQNVWSLFSPDSSVPSGKSEESTAQKESSQPNTASGTSSEEDSKKANTDNENLHL